MRKRCNGKTKKGHQCLNIAIEDSNFCRLHQNQEWMSIVKVFGGSILGQILLPGWGALFGGLGGLWADKSSQPKWRKSSSIPRVFVSFDFDNDRQLKHFLIGQARLAGSPFRITDWSMKEAAQEKYWTIEAERRIKNSDIVLVLVGEETHRAKGVIKEVELARQNSIPIVQMKGYRNLKCTSVAGAGRLYRWNWQNLQSLLGKKENVNTNY